MGVEDASEKASSSHDDQIRDAPTLVLRKRIKEQSVVGQGDRHEMSLCWARRDPAADSAFSLNLHARYHHEAIITVTKKGAVVLGIGLDDPTIRRRSASEEQRL